MVAIDLNQKISTIILEAIIVNYSSWDFDTLSNAIAYFSLYEHFAQFIYLEYSTIGKSFALYCLESMWQVATVENFGFIVILKKSKH